MPQGVIKKITNRGFGFIKPDEGEKDLFFHMSGLLKGLKLEDLNEEDRVEYDVVDSDKGPRAVHINKL